MVKKVTKLPQPYSRTKVVELPKIRDANVTPDKLNPYSADVKLNHYYDSLMRDHFLFEKDKEAVTENISAKLK